MHRGETNDTLPYQVALWALCIFLFEDSTTFLFYFTCFVTHLEENVLLHFSWPFVYMLFAWTHLKRCHFCNENSFLLLNLWLKRTKTKRKHCSWNKSANTTEVRLMPWQTAPQRELQVISLPIKAGPGEEFTQWSNPWGRWTNKASHWRMALRSVTLWTWPK